MTRRRAILLAGVLIVLGAAGFGLLGPFGDEPLPLADRVPADCRAYVGFPDPAWIDRLPAAWTESFRADLEQARPFLAGALAVYVDREGEWVALARLRRGSAMMAEVALDGDAAVFAQSAAALHRHRRRTGSLLDDPAFRSLGRRIYVNLERLGLPGDFAAAGFDYDADWTLTGLVTYRRGLRRTYLERYVHRPRAGLAGGDGCARGLVTIDPRGIHDAIVAPLDDAERAGVKGYLGKLSEELLGGKAFADFLDRIGPGAGFEIHAGDSPGATAWVDLADDRTRERVEQVLRRTIPDIERLGTRGKGKPYVKVTAFEDPLWRLEFPRLPHWPDLDAVCTFDGNRFVVASRPGLLPAPPPAAGEDHVALTLDVAAVGDTLPEIERRLTGKTTLDVPPEVRAFKMLSLNGRFTGEGVAVTIRLTPAP